MKNDRFIKNILIAVLFFLVLWYGIIPLVTGTSFSSYTKNAKKGNLTLKENEYAVIVVGSEPEGISSAVACARTGLKTLLVTEDENLGSYIEKSLISSMKPDEGLIKDKKVLLNGGIYEEIFGKLKVGFRPEDYIASVKNLVSKEKNLQILYSTQVTEAVIENGAVKGVHLDQGGRSSYLKASVFIDATRSGTFLELCHVPFSLGSEDINVANAYMPVGFNFVISGVKWEELSKIQKTSDFSKEFKDYLMFYERTHKRTKITSPTFIKQSGDEFIISGLMQWGVDVNDPEDVNKAYRDAMDEALMLTAYMKSVFIPFKDCTFKIAPEELYIPEYRHFQGRYVLTVSDIMNNRDFKTKIALASAPVDAGKFVDQGYDYVVTDPKVYSIPLESIIPVNLDNVLMVGPKASFKSLAATSAGTIPTSITIGEAAGLTGAYCFLNNIKPSQLIAMDESSINQYESFLKRGGIFLEDFSEKIKIGKTQQALDTHWSYPYLAELAEYGLIAGGFNNDFRLDSEASCDVFAILLKNAVVKLSPNAFSLDFDDRMKQYETTAPLTGEKAAAIILDAKNVPFEEGMALKTAQSLGHIPPKAADMLSKHGNVTMDVVYCLVIETARSF